MAEIIAEIPQGRGEVIRVTREMIYGRDIVKLRIWFRAADGEMRPGKEGIPIRADGTLGLVIEGMRMAEVHTWQDK